MSCFHGPLVPLPAGAYCRLLQVAAPNTRSLGRRIRCVGGPAPLHGLGGTVREPHGAPAIHADVYFCNAVVAALIEHADACGFPPLLADYTFFCALHPAMRHDWAAAYARYLAPGALLVCLAFPIVPAGEHPTGPPWPVKPQDYKDVLLPLGELSFVRKRLVWCDTRL